MLYTKVSSYIEDIINLASIKERGNYVLNIKKNQVGWAKVSNPLEHIPYLKLLNDFFLGQIDSELNTLILRFD